jgi:nucleosome binding factor SPN SPT16 subunit
LLARIDLLFSNIKHLFFQPCAHELIVIIHVHLKAPIMIGKKKAKVCLSIASLQTPFLSRHGKLY